MAFVAWATFFAAGGGRPGFTKGLAANLSGVAWAWLASKALGHATFNGAVAIAVTVLGVVLCLQAALPLLSFIPGAFIGTAVFFGTSFDLGGSVLALVAAPASASCRRSSRDGSRPSSTAPGRDRPSRGGRGR